MFKKAAKPKTLKGQFVTGSMLVELASSYVQALNGGKVPTIESAWDSVQAAELERAYREAVIRYERGLQEEVVMKLPMIEAKERDTLKRLKMQANEVFLS